MASEDNATPTVVNSQITCWSYTHARRHPSVLGKVGGANLPFGPYSPMQFAVFGLTFALLLMTQSFWGGVVSSGVGKTGVMLFVPGGAMWFARHVRVEGRSPFRFALGMAQRLSAPRHGLCRGQRMRRPRATRQRGHAYSVELTTGRKPIAELLGLDALLDRSTRGGTA